MKNSKQLLITFDYELFLGDKSGTVENCMLKPTNEILKVISKYQLSTIFFVDTLYLFQLKQIAKIHEVAKIDYDKIIQQLRKVIEVNGYVFHHLHPHWLDAKYLTEINQWNVSDKSKFALSNLSDFEVDMVFNQSNEIINEIYEGLQKPKTFGYRAGGLYAQPFLGYNNQMEKHNVTLDFSVMRNAKSDGNKSGYKFDYSQYPEERIFRFSEEVNVKDENGKFTEFTMDQCQINGIYKILNGLYYRKNFKKDSWKRWGDGTSSGNIVKSTGKESKFKSEESFSIELLNSVKSTLYSSYFQKEDFLHIISHPKFFSPMNINAFDRFLLKVTSKYLIESDVFRISSI
jgi:hypothetical protein